MIKQNIFYKYNKLMRCYVVIESEYDSESFDDVSYATLNFDDANNNLKKLIKGRISNMKIDRYFSGYTVKYLKNKFNSDRLPIEMSDDDFESIYDFLYDLGIYTIQHTEANIIKEYDGNVEYSINIKENEYWFLNNMKHRVGGPSVIYNDGNLEYFYNGKRHRTDGVAILDDLSSSYYVDGVQYFDNGSSFKQAVKEWEMKNIDDKINNILL